MNVTAISMSYSNRIVIISGWINSCRTIEQLGNLQAFVEREKEAGKLMEEIRDKVREILGGVVLLR